MKKFIIAVAVLLLLGGCEKSTEIQSGTVAETFSETSADTAVQTETSRETTTVTESTAVTTEEETTVTEREYTEGEEMLIAFLSYLQNGTHYSFEFGNPIDVYDFMDDLKIDNYSYTHRGDGVYDVALTCSESSCELFPDGESHWVYSFNFDTLFIPAEREKDFNVLTHAYRKKIFDLEAPKGSKVYAAYSAAVDFSLVTGVFEADGEWFESYIETNTHGFYHAYQQDISTRHISENGEPINEPVPIDDFIKAVKKLYNVTVSPDIDGYADSVYCAGHGGSWLYDDFAGYDENDGEIKIRVDYYGDELYLYVVLQSEYTFSKNGDGTITLQNVEKIFDSDYTPACGSI